MWDFLQAHWAIIALILSEVLAFVPSKYSGIAKAVFNVLKALFTAPVEDQFKSANKKYNLQKQFKQ